MNMTMNPDTFTSTLKAIQPHFEWDRVLLSGEKGTNREIEKPCQISAHHDYEAIQCWLNEYQHKTTTYRAYQKEAERLLLWCILQQKKPLSSLTRDDFEVYFAFLENPQPHSVWCASRGGRHKKRGESGWRPFERGLSLTAKSQAMTIINSLMTYLVDGRYLVFNPLLLMRKKNHLKQNISHSSQKVIDRILEPDEWQVLWESIDEIKNEDQKERTRFLIAILLLLGLRAEELATHRWNAFQKIEGQWWFRVIGKGNKPGMIPVNDELLHHMIQYRTFLGKVPFPTSEEDTPIITSLQLFEKALTTRQMNNVIKSLIDIALPKFKEAPHKIKKLKKVSVHWFRHLSATLQYEAGVDEKYIQKNLRHSNRTTTQHYNHTLLKRRHQEMQKLSLKLY